MPWPGPGRLAHGGAGMAPRILALLALLALPVGMATAAVTVAR